MYYFSRIAGISDVEFSHLAVFCGNALTGETLHSAEFLIDILWWLNIIQVQLGA